MKSLEELIEEIRREALGETAPPSEEGAGSEVTEGAEPPDVTAGPASPGEDSVSEGDFEIRFETDLPVPSVDDPPEGLPATWERDEAEVAKADEELRRLFEEPAEAPAPIPYEPPPIERPIESERPPKPRRQRKALALRSLLIALGVVALGVGAVMGARLLSGDGSRSAPPPTTAPPLVEQDVVSWAVWDPETPGSAFVTVFTGGGDLDPIALGIPPYTYVNVPGYGDATVGDAAALHDDGLVAAAVENLIGVQVDALERSTFEGLAAVVDRLGGIDVEGEPMDGAGVVAYLSAGDDEAVDMELRFLRWQSVTDGILRASAGRAEALTETLPPEIAGVVAAAGSGGAEVLELPVTDIGSGLSRPDPEAVEALVAQRFVPTRQTDRTVRLAVMNGAGVPGIGERVSRVLLPAGFRLVVSGNAPSFDVRETQIIAESEDFLPEAELAQRLLGVGRVYLGQHPTGLVDVTVTIGRDFAGQ